MKTGNKAFCFVVNLQEAGDRAGPDRREQTLRETRLSLVVAAEHFDDLVFYDFFDGSAGIAEVLSGIEMVGMFRKVFADRSRTSYAQVGVDVDFADGHRSGFAEHFFGDTDRIGHFAAELVDNGNSVLRNGRSAV